MRTHFIQHNFVDVDKIEMDAYVHPSETVGAIVNIHWRECGPVSFQFGMRPEQAREMAAKLLELAAAVEIEAAAKKQAQGFEGVAA